MKVAVKSKMYKKRKIKLYKQEEQVSSKWFSQYILDHEQAQQDVEENHTIWNMVPKVMCGTLDEDAYEDNIIMCLNHHNIDINYLLGINYGPR